MADQNNRHLRGATNEIHVDVHGNSVINKGDLMVEFKDNSTMRTPGGTAITTADGYGFPVSQLLDSTSIYYAEQFIGVAMTGSVAGVTEKIPVATSGIFRFPLDTGTASYNSTLRIGYIVSGATSAAKTCDDQQVNCKALVVKSEPRIGRCVRAQSSASNVDFELLTRYSGVSYADLV